MPCKRLAPVSNQTGGTTREVSMATTSGVRWACRAVRMSVSFATRRGVTVYCQDASLISGEGKTRSHLAQVRSSGRVCVAGCKLEKNADLFSQNTSFESTTFLFVLTPPRSAVSITNRVNETRSSAAPHYSDAASQATHQHVSTAAGSSAMMCARFALRGYCAVAPN